MANAALDQNDKPTLILRSVVDGSIQRALVDPVTDYLLASILPISDFATTNPPVKIDENAVRTGAAVTAGGAIKPLLTDPNNPGYLLANVISI